MAQLHENKGNFGRKGLHWNRKIRARFTRISSQAKAQTSEVVVWGSWHRILAERGFTGIGRFAQGSPESHHKLRHEHQKLWSGALGIVSGHGGIGSDSCQRGFTGIGRFAQGSPESHHKLRHEHRKLWSGALGIVSGHGGIGSDSCR
ncbi:hypothetical protein VNO78_34752 [Psophocarpus tetragonolobus]|uniref:Uncharacterized protein n=1 Tax=Psophocarpus tetragonolobus TaxID=3891 RepID=A0AAN9NSU7_PSOTE